MNTRFLLATNGAMALIALSLALVPSVIVLGETQKELFKSDGLRVLVLVLSLSVFLLLGLLYASRKGDLAWIRSYRRESEE
jgi:hypothetical protein